ncbi:MAG: hypothetical protein WCP21_12265, partial [Armatimonadota bacterium]
MSDPYFDTLMGLGPKRMLHMEHWSNPDAETYLTDIDYYEHPKLCRERLRELYPQLGLGVPETDAPKPRPKLSLQGETSDAERHTVRWGDGETGSYLHGEAYFHSADEVFAFSPLEHADFTAWRHVVMDWDFSSEEVIYERLRPQWPAEWGDTAPEGSAAGTWFYNTTFMWPM